MFLLVAPAALVLAGAAACGTAAASSSGPTMSTAPPSAAPGSTSSATLTVTAVPGFGKIVTTGSGKTVYRYDLDTGNPSKSNCTGTCASIWTPVKAPASGAPKVSGITARVGEITRVDGGKQVTLAGWPLYTYAGDTAAGQSTGQGSGGTWWVVSPTGAKIMMPAGGSPSAPSGGGY